MASSHFIVDTQLLVLYVVGLTSISHIGRHKRLGAFSVRDFELLYTILQGAKGVVVTPHVLAETSSLVRQIGEPARTDIMEMFRHLIGKATETHVPGRVAAEQAEFARLGLTDTALLTVDDPPMTLLTADTELYLAAANARRPVANFNHIREAQR